MRRTVLPVLLAIIFCATAAHAAGYYVEGLGYGIFHDYTLDRSHYHWLFYPHKPYADISDDGKYFEWGKPVHMCGSSSWLRFDDSTELANGFWTTGNEAYSFSVGTLSFFNSTTWRWTNANSVGLKTVISLVSPTGEVLPFEWDLGIYNTPGIGTDDYVGLTFDVSGGPSSRTFTDVAGNSYLVTLEGFYQDGSLVSQLVSAAGATSPTEAQLMASISRNSVCPTPIPEASSLLLAIPGLVGVIGLKLRKR